DIAAKWNIRMFTKPAFLGLTGQHGRSSNDRRTIPMVRPPQPAIWALSWRTALILKVSSVILGLNVSRAYGQTTVPQRPEFEVASVKPHSSSESSPNVPIARDPGG